MEQVTILGALLGGLISFVSPCVLPIVPATIGYIAGVKIDQLVENQGNIRWHTLWCVLAFVAGFSLIFVLLGSSVPLFARVLNLPIVRIIAGAMIVIMGLHFIGLFKIGLLYREFRFNIGISPGNIASAFVLGLAFAFGWTPCIGPILAAIYFQAGQSGDDVWGMTLLSVYALGLGIPFIIAALFIDRFMSMSRSIRGYFLIIEKILGSILVIYGIMIMTNKLSWISYWLLEIAPEFFAKIG